MWHPDLDDTQYLHAFAILQIDAPRDLRPRSSHGLVEKSQMQWSQSHEAEHQFSRNRSVRSDTKDISVSWSPRRPLVSIGGCGSASHVLGRDDELSNCPSTAFIDICNIIGRLCFSFLETAQDDSPVVLSRMGHELQGWCWGSAGVISDKNELVD